MTVSRQDSVNPRGAAYDRMRAKEICDREGHIRPYEVWYDRNRDNPQPCLRGCGELVQPQIDYSGHP